MKTYTTARNGFESEYGRAVRRTRTLYLEDTLEEFAKKLGITPRYLNKIELGKVEPSQALRIKIEYFMDMYSIEY